MKALELWTRESIEEALGADADTVLPLGRRRIPRSFHAERRDPRADASSHRGTIRELWQTPKTI